jgi:hypothetical protein
VVQLVGYFENNVSFLEGPFVLTRISGSGYRIEVEQKGHHCPVLPDSSIYALREERFNFSPGIREDLGPISRVCEALNKMVRNGEIVLEGCSWVYRGER